MRLAPLRPNSGPALAGYAEIPDLDRPWIRGYLRTGGRSIPRVGSELTRRDVLDGWKVRWGIGRSDSRVMPGLYALGEPNRGSQLFVSANYKLSFDTLRRGLAGLDAWILVLDTKGINVWCAAGKGTFGTAELLDKIGRLRLAELLSHRVLILPQLGASGVSAPEVSRLSGFRVVYGPVRAGDIHAFLESGMKKDEGMRRVEFTFRDRIILVPIELVHTLPYIAVSIPLALLAGFPAGEGYAGRAATALAALLGTILAGTVAFPSLLPFLPSQAFSIKGAILGALWGGVCGIVSGASILRTASFVLVGGAVVAFLGLNFTGSTTFTSQRGAQLEVDRGMLPMILALAAGAAAAGAAAILGA
jgi:hypothetical protein